MRTPDTMLDAMGPHFNVRQWGATGTGYPTDDAPAINAALHEAASVNGVVELPPGTYYVAAPVVVPSGVAEVYGYGSATILTGAGGTSPLMRLDGGTSVLSHLRVHDLAFRDNSAARGIEVAGTAQQNGTEYHYCQLDHLRFSGLLYGIRVIRLPIIDPSGALTDGAIHWWHWSHLWFHADLITGAPQINGIQFDHGSGTGNIFSNIHWDLAPDGKGIAWLAPAGEGIGDLTLYGLQTATGAGGTGLYFDPRAAYREHVTVMASQFDGGPGVGIDMQGYANVTIRGALAGGAVRHRLTGTSGDIAS